MTLTLHPGLPPAPSGQFGVAGLVAVASLLYHQTRGAVNLFEYRFD